MTGLPNLFGAPKNVAADKQLSRNVTIVLEATHGRKKHVGEKNKTQDVTEEPLLKKQNTSSIPQVGAPTIIDTVKITFTRVFNSFGQSGDSHISEAELKGGWLKLRRKNR